MEEQKLCRQCQLPGPFHESYLARSNYLCKSCVSQSIKACRTKTPERLLAYRAYNTFHHPVSQEMIKRVLERCEYRSVISGEQDINMLCIYPFFKDIPLDEDWHLLIVTRYEARSLSRSKNLIPTDIQEKLQKERGRKKIK